MIENGRTKPKVLVTGGCGKIGSYFIRSMHDRYDFRIVDKRPWDADRHGEPFGECRVINLQDPHSCLQACEGMDLVVHLAADPLPTADFLTSLVDNNILATYHMFQAAKAAGCRRFIFASSIHAVGSHPRDVQIKLNMPVCPTSMYGVSKCFGEALASHYAYNESLPAIAMRIGAYLFPNELDMLDAHETDGYLHPDDFNHLLVQCLETPDVQFAIVHAISNNHFKRLDLSETRQIFNYQPQADSFEMLGLMPKGVD